MEDNGKVAALAGPSGTADRPKHITRIIRDLVQGAWRRRLLIVLPILLMLPVSIAAAIILPKAYTARALMQLQEAGRDNPFSREGDPASSVYRVQERFAGLRALFMSESVLAKALGAEVDRLPPVEREATIGELRQALSLDLIGGDFIEVKLVGAKPEGLGKRLEAVMASFLEALVPEQGGATAAQLMVNARRQELDALLRIREEVQRELAALLPDGSEDAAATALTGSMIRVRGLQDRLAALDREIAAARESYESYQQRFSGATSVRSVGILKAPELIRIVDPPRDPATASRSRFMYFVSGITAGGLLGLGLAFIAERLDQRVRHADEASEATGLPVLAVVRDPDDHKEHVGSGHVGDSKPPGFSAAAG
ncbi:hypothetical protein [Microvirga sp. KLBC 81]|uniref:hypothetical protein n=1 Tax=Microvirga sp. KLBC 81 TaxID=1862707 RepID=UPI00140386E8|nr:hypothetical protein [Microvirga sp. KLBC 81]